LRHPVTLMTKSSLVLRDLELLSIMARSGLAQVLISLCTLDNELAKVLEPHAGSPQARLETIRKLSAAGVPVGIVVAPVIPGLTDLGIEALLAAAYAAGARSASHMPLRLPRELVGEFDRWLLWHASKPVSRLNAVLYGPYACTAAKAPPANPIRGFDHYARLIEQRFQLASQSVGYDASLPELNYDDFRASPQSVPEADSDDGQGILF
jgi:DNA repair photolyase